MQDVVVDGVSTVEQFRKMNERSYDRMFGSLSFNPLIEQSLAAWVLFGTYTGGFCRAMLANDLTESFSRADETNLAHMEDIVSWAFNCCPLGARGSEEQRLSWHDAGGLVGLRKHVLKLEEADGQLNV